jgi:hypothetical protein
MIYHFRKENPMSKINNQNELAAELAIRCSNSKNFKGDINVAQASHVLKNLKEIVQSDDYAGRTFKTSKKLSDEIVALKDEIVRLKQERSSLISVTRQQKDAFTKFVSMSLWQRIKFVFIKR